MAMFYEMERGMHEDERADCFAVKYNPDTYLCMWGEQADCPAGKHNCDTYPCMWVSSRDSLQFYV